MVFHGRPLIIGGLPVLENNQFSSVDVTAPVVLVSHIDEFIKRGRLRASKFDIGKTYFDDSRRSGLSGNVEKSF
jgi:hypothetical protein